MQGKMREKGIPVPDSWTGQGLYTSGEASKFPQDHIFCPHRIILLFFSLMYSHMFPLMYYSHMCSSSISFF
uniref:Uncharacterized protein n=1 Tax=Setaria italica TaxID=4555 RepID=K3Z188_SETIT